MRDLSNWFYTHSRYAWAVPLTVVAFGFMWLFNASHTAYSVADLAVKYGVPILDTRPFYTPAEVGMVLARYGEPGRAAYLNFLAMDYAFVVIYGLAYTGLLSALSRGLHLPGRLNLLPLAVAGFDAMENVCTLIDLNTWPDVNSPVVWIGCAMTICKNLSAVASIALLLTAVWQRLRVRLRLRSRQLR